LLEVRVYGATSGEWKRKRVTQIDAPTLRQTVTRSSAIAAAAVDSTLRKKAQVFDNTGLARARAELQTVFIK